MRYSGIQPQYFPRLHYFARILNADIFMIRDDVQYVQKHKYPDGKVDKSYQAHTPIKQSFGRFLLTIPVKHVGFPKLTETPISYEFPWPEDHLKTLQITYSKSPNFSNIQPELEEVLRSEYDNLAEMNMATILWAVLQLLGHENIKKDNLTLDYVNKKLAKQNIFRLKEIKRATQTKISKDLDKMPANEKIIALCQEVGATEDYCGGTAAAAYMDEEIYKKAGIKTVVQDWKCHEYTQLFIKQQGFIPNLSIIDLLMNASLDQARKIIAG